MTRQRARRCCFSLGGKSRSYFCLRFPVNFIFSINVFIWSVVILPTFSKHASQSSTEQEDSQHWLSHLRAPALCGHTFSGLEGTAIKGFSLDQAFVVTTPGLTFHQNVDSLLNYGQSDTHCHFHKFAKLHPKNKIKSYNDALLLKQKTLKNLRPTSSFKVFKPVPSSIRCKENMLTPQGVAQNIRLGEYLALSYFKALNSLSPSTLETKDMAHSVGDELLYQSVHAVLYGLLSEKQFIRAGVGKLSHLFTKGDSESRDDAQEQLSYFVKQSFMNEHHLFKDASSPTSDRWSIDSEFGSDLSAKDILSSVSLKHCDKLLKDSVHLSHDLIESVLSVSDSHNKYLLNSSIFYNYSKSTSFPFRNFLNSWITSSHKYSNTDLKLISVDDLFMLSLLAMFNQVTVKHIPPVSRLVIEQFHFKNPSSNHMKPSTSIALKSDIKSSPSSPTSISSQQRASHHRFQEVDFEPKYNMVDPRDVFIRVLYNGKVITNDIKNCRSDSFVSLGLCSLPNFSVGLMTGKISCRGEL